MAEQRGPRRRGSGATGTVVVVALAAIAGAWLLTTFSGGIARAYDGTMTLIFSPNDDELRSAASEYFDSLDYEGSDGDEYRSQIEPHILPEAYYDSSAGRAINGDAEGLNGSDSTWRIEYELRNFRVQNSTRDEATATVEFKQSFWEDNEFTGSGVYRQPMHLSKINDEWKVSGSDEGERLQTNVPEDGAESTEGSSGSGDGTEQSEGFDETTSEETSAEEVQSSGASDPGEEEVEDAVRGHYEAIGEGDFEEAYSYFGPTFGSSTSQQGWIAEQESQDIRSSEVESVEVEEVGQEEATAEVEVSFEDSTGNPSFELRWALVEEGGDWKLDEQISGEKVGEANG